MIENLFLIGGIAIMIYSLFLCNKLLRIVNERKIRTHWIVLFLLISFFLLGYIIFFISITVPSLNFKATTLLVSSIFFLGAIFVALVLRSSYLTVNLIDEDSGRLKNINKELKQNHDLLREQSGELKQKIDELEKFNKMAVGRELKMVELKRTINALEQRLREK